jgi:polysaccharide biosynthesis/export protein
MGRGVRLILLASLALLVSNCAPPGPTLVGQKLGSAPKYVIGPGDTLDVFVYRAPELSAVIPVRPDGRISTPLVPDVVAMGKTPAQLAAVIKSRLKNYIKEPNVTVMATGFVGAPGRQVRVIGEVGQPLVMPYHAGLSLLDVMIAAKGLTRFAAGNQAVLVRQTPSGQKIYNVRLDDLLQDGDILQNVKLRPGDTVFVPQAWF